MQWTIDSAHSSVEFVVRHMGISNVRGHLKGLKGTIEVADHALRAVTVSMEAASINTGEPQRDAHLRSADFLDAERYPTIIFQSAKIEPQGPDRYRVHGDLTIRGTARPVSLEVETTSSITDPQGQLRVAATGTSRLNRKEWGLTWNKMLEFGALMVGEDVRFTFDVEATAPQSAAAR